MENEQILPLPLSPLKQARTNEENKTRQAGPLSIYVVHRSTPGAMYALCILCVYAFSVQERQIDGVSSKNSGVCGLRPAYALGIRGWLYQFGTNLTSVVNLNDTSTSIAIRDLEEFLVVR